MTEENDPLKNFMVNGFNGFFKTRAYAEDEEDREGEEGEIELETEHEIEDKETTAGIESELIRIRYMLEDLTSQKSAEQEPAPAPQIDLEGYMLTKEAVKNINSSIAKIEANASNKALLRAMEQISAMREDFFKLCKEVRLKIDEMDAHTVLNSFEAYEVDMENILTDAGVYIGSFDYSKLNTLHQRIVGVVPTDEKEKDGTIAERLSNGYKLGDKVLLKERVNVYKFTQNSASDKPKAETDSETVSETASETVSGDPEEKIPEDVMEEKE